MSLLKKTYHLVAGLALLNLLVMGGIVVHLSSQGQLTGDKLRAVVELLHAPAEAEGTEPTTAAEGSAATTTEEATQPTPVEREIARLNLERVTRAAEDQLKYSSRIMVDIERNREDLQRQKEELERARTAAASATTAEGFQKDLEVLSLLKPKIALDNLLALDVEAAARLMRAMESRTAKKIVEAASKEPAKWGQMLQIQEKMRAPIADETAPAAVDRNGVPSASARP